MSTFILEGFKNPVTVNVPKDIITTESEDVTKEKHNKFAQEFQEFPGFKTWKEALITNLALQYTRENHQFHKKPYELRSVTVQSVDRWGKGNPLGFVKINAEIKNDAGGSLPGIALLRGGSVAVLMIIRPTDSPAEKYVIMVEQSRAAIGSLAFLEIPAGMLDDSKHFSGRVASEIEEETGLKVKDSKELVNLSELAFEQSEDNVPENSLQKGVYPSPGGLDEFIPIFLWEKTDMTKEEVDKLKGKLTGEREKGEKCKVHVVKYDDLWKVGARDGKTLAAYALYEGLSKSGKLNSL